MTRKKILVNTLSLLVSSPLVLTSLSLSSCASDDAIVTRDYQIVVNNEDDYDYSYAHQINEALKYSNNFTLPIVVGSSPIISHEIIFDMDRPEAREVYNTLGSYEYAIKEDHGKIIMAYTSHMSKLCAVDHLLTEFYNPHEGINVPKNTLVKGSCKPEDVVTEITLPEDTSDASRRIRDPFILKENNKYYMYGTSAVGTSSYDSYDWRVYEADSLAGPWTKYGIVVSEPESLPYSDIQGERWAPEVHKYKDNKYYMFTTYHSKKTDCRGVTILRSDSPEGNFEIISKNEKNEICPGHITDDNGLIDEQGAHHQNCTIDGTLYVDPQGQPWLVYVNEWVSQLDKVGRFSAVKLSDDLTTIDESTNQELFRADAAPWGPPGIQVTDGCFIHTMPSGRLLMTWSADNGHGYSVGFATSDHGVLGPWEQHQQQLYVSHMFSSEAPDGGHCMIFEDNGQLYMCLHGPNSTTEHPIVFPVKETEYNTIAWDLYKPAN